jgi:IS30 family transposase
MDQRQSRRLSAGQKSELWNRWRNGQSLTEIGCALGRHLSSIFEVVAREGGIVRAERSRSPLAITLSEREEISRGIVAGASMRQIAAAIQRSPSSVCREIARHGGRARYRAAEAESQAWDRARRPKSCLLARHGRLQRIVASKLQLNWSPEQISGWLKAQFADDASMRISHETIYRSLFLQARGVLKRELMSHLRSQRVMRRSKKASKKGQARGQIVDAISIRERPAEIEDRAIPGHWEGDLIAGSKNSYIATLVERHSRFTMLVKVGGKDTLSVISALTKQVQKLPLELRRSLTWDRGLELAQHKAFTVATDVKVYFCDPRSPWQRGTNENTNGLLRQYFPKGTELSHYSQADLNKIALQLNQRPRKTLGFQDPASKLQASVALTG